MVDLINHRGPDSSDVFIDTLKNIALGHTRLSIVDITGGAQPMTDVYGRYTIVFNGEIYGFKELRAQYSDYPYQTNSDTELLFAMLHKHGQSFVNHLPGMFAFVIYDKQTDSLFGARDRFGEKPFYYTTTLNGFAFSSEIKGLKVLFKERPLTINKRAISSYLERLCVPVNECIYNEIDKLLPGHAFSFQKSKLEIFPYWSIDSKIEKVSFEQAVDNVYEKLTVSVKKQLVADVEVGAFLSGGIDSSLIAAIANKHSHKQISTYSFGFTSNAARNELDEARMHAQKLGTKHHEFDERDFNLFKEFLTMQRIFDEPFGDSSCIPMFIISNCASKHGRVVLTGDGGDELFGGYSQWNNPTRESALKYQKNPINYRLNELKEFGKIVLKGRLGNYRKLKRTKSSINVYRHRHEHNNVFFTWRQLIELGLPVPYSYIYTDFENNSLSDVLNTDILNYMPADILVKTDMTSMANGLELRAPFLDIDLAKYAISIPVEYKTVGDVNKKILRRIMEKYHPELQVQKGKLGFGAPVDEWLMLKEFQDYKRVLRENKEAPMYQYLDYSKATEYLSRNNYKTWLLINLNAWLENNLK